LSQQFQVGKFKLLVMTFAGCAQDQMVACMRLTQKRDSLG